MYRLIITQILLFSATFCFGQNTDEHKSGAVNDYIGVYQKYISGIRGQHCPMYPSCSHFGAKSFSEVGFFSAALLTSDRLLRCGNDLKYYPITVTGDGVRKLDFPGYLPVPKNLIYSRKVNYYAFSDTIIDDSNTVFIKKLINNEYYHEALLEINRIEFKSNLVLEMFINKMICLRSTDNLEKALLEYELKCPSEYKESPELLYQIVLIHYKLENYNKVLYFDSIAIANCKDCQIKAKLIDIKGLSHAQLGEWENAKSAYDSLAKFDSFRSLAIANSSSIQNVKNSKYKKPLIGGLAALLPGAGYAYSRHYQTGLSSLIVNGLLGFATYSSINNRNYGMATLTGVFNLAFYIANIQGSVKSVHRYNKKRKNKYLEQIIENSTIINY